MSGKIIVVRHGDTDLNAKGGESAEERIRGWMDVPLNAQGEAHAKQLAVAIEKQHPDVAAIFYSPLQRAEVTARMIGQAIGVKPRSVRELMPWNVGQFTGQPVKTVGAKMDLLVHHETASPPGGEPFARFRQRALGFINHLEQQVRASGQTVCCVTHTRVTNLIQAWLAAGAKPDLSINPDRMTDYSQEVKPGHAIVLDTATPTKVAPVRE